MSSNFVFFFLGDISPKESKDLFLFLLLLTLAGAEELGSSSRFRVKREWVAAANLCASFSNSFSYFDFFLSFEFCSDSLLLVVSITVTCGLLIKGLCL